MKVIIAFDPDHSKIGKTVTVDDDEAALMIREGRARPADKDAELPIVYQAPTVQPPMPDVVPPLAEQVPGAQPIPAPAGKPKSSGSTPAKSTSTKSTS